MGKPWLVLIVFLLALATVGILGVPVAFYNIVTSGDKFTRTMGAITLFTAFPMVVIWGVLFSIFTTAIKEKP